MRFRQIICSFPGFCFALAWFRCPLAKGPQAERGKQRGPQAKSHERTGGEPRGQKTVLLWEFLSVVMRIQPVARTGLVTSRFAPVPATFCSRI